MGRRKRNDKFVEKGEATTPMLTRRAKSLKETDIVNAVFNNPLLLDKIVKYSIYKSNGKQLNKQAIVAIRLVNKGWLQSASRELAKSGEWAIKITVGSLGEYNPRERSWAETENNLDKFVAVFSKTARSVDSIVPINFSMEESYMKKENGKELREFLEQCSDIICEFSVEYPIDVDLMNLKDISANFAILRAFEIRLEGSEDPNAYESISKSFNGSKLLQQILESSQSLQRFTLTNDHDHTSVFNKSSIKLPVTINSLTLCGPLAENQLIVLRKNRLPKLKTLNLDINNEATTHLAYKILEHFQQQLTTLSILVNKIYHDYDEEPCICVKLPRMEKLKCLKLFGESYSLSPELRQVWPQLIPNLAQLEIKIMSESKFLEWVQGCSFENVKKLKISLACQDGNDCTLSPSVQVIKEIITSFPKIEKLTLKFMLSEISSLKYLFKNLTQLKKLKLSFKIDDSCKNPGHKLISIFLGIPMKLSTALVDKPAKKVKIAVENLESIMNLTELQSLTLKASKYFFPIDQMYLKVISKHGLAKMPKLQNIKLLGGFELQQ